MHKVRWPAISVLLFSSSIVPRLQVHSCLHKTRGQTRGFMHAAQRVPKQRTKQVAAMHPTAGATPQHLWIQATSGKGIPNGSCALPCWRSSSSCVQSPVTGPPGVSPNDSPRTADRNCGPAAPRARPTLKKWYCKDRLGPIEGPMPYSTRRSQRLIITIVMKNPLVGLAPPLADMHTWTVVTFTWTTVPRETPRAACAVGFKGSAHICT